MSDQTFVAITTAASLTKIAVPYTPHGAAPNSATQDFYPVIFKPQDDNACDGSPFALRLVMLATHETRAKGLLSATPSASQLVSIYQTNISPGYPGMLALFVPQYAAQSGQPVKSELDTQLNASCVQSVLATFADRNYWDTTSGVGQYQNFVPTMSKDDWLTLAWVHDLAHPDQSLNNPEPYLQQQPNFDGNQNQQGQPLYIEDGANMNSGLVNAMLMSLNQGYLMIVSQSWLRLGAETYLFLPSSKVSDDNVYVLPSTDPLSFSFQCHQYPNWKFIRQEKTLRLSLPGGVGDGGFWGRSGQMTSKYMDGERSLQPTIQLTGGRAGLVQGFSGWLVGPAGFKDSQANLDGLKAVDVFAFFSATDGGNPVRTSLVDSAAAAPQNGLCQGDIFAQADTKAGRLGYSFQLCPLAAQGIVPAGVANDGAYYPHAFYLAASLTPTDPQQEQTAASAEQLRELLPTANLFTPDGAALALTPQLMDLRLDTRWQYIGFALGQRPVPGDATGTQETCLMPLGSYQVTANNTQLMCGLSGQEFLLLNAGDTLEFHPAPAQLAPYTSQPPDGAMMTSWVTVNPIAQPEDPGAQDPVFHTSYWSQAQDFVGYQAAAGTLIEAVGLRVQDLVPYLGQRYTPYCFPFLPFGQALQLPGYIAGQGKELESFERTTLRYRRWVFENLANRPTGVGPCFYDLTYVKRNPGDTDPNDNAAIIGKICTPQGFLITTDDDGGETLPPGSWQGLVLARGTDNPQQSLSFKLTFDGDQIATDPRDLFYALAFGAPNLLLTGVAATAWAKSFTENEITLGEFTFRLDLAAAATDENIPMMIFKLAGGVSLLDLLRDPQQHRWVDAAQFTPRQPQGFIYTSPVTGHTTQGVQALLNRMADQIAVAPEAKYNDATVGSQYDNELFDDFRARLNAQDWTGVLFLNCPLDVRQLPPDIQMILSGIDHALTAHHLIIDQNAVDASGEIISSSLSAVISYDASKGGDGKYELGDKFKDKTQAHFQTLSLHAQIRNSQLVHFDSLIAFAVPELFGETVKLQSGDTNDRCADSTFGNVIEIGGAYVKNKDGKGGQIVFDSTVPRIFAPDNPQGKWRAVQQFTATDVRMLPVSSTPDTSNSDQTNIVSHFALRGSLALHPDVGSGHDLFSFGEANGLLLGGYNFEIVSHITQSAGGYTTSIDEPIGTDFSAVTLSEFGAAGTVAPSANSLLASMPWRVSGLRLPPAGQQLTAALTDGRVVTGTGLTDAAFTAGGLSYAIVLTATLGSLGALQSSGNLLTATLLLGWRSTGQQNDDNVTGAIFVPPPGMTADGGFKLEGVMHGTYENILLGTLPGTANAYCLEISGVEISILNKVFQPSHDNGQIWSLYFYGDPDSPQMGNLKVSNWKRPEAADDALMFESLAVVADLPKSDPNPVFNVGIAFCIGSGYKLNAPMDYSDPGAIGKIVEAFNSVQSLGAATGPLPLNQSPGKPPVFSKDDNGGFLILFSANFWLFALSGVFYDKGSFFAAQLAVPDKTGTSTWDGGAWSVLDGLFDELRGLNVFFVYRKLNDGCGLYAVNLTLPKKFRVIELGSYKLTLPQISAQIYTDGGYKMSFGWPISDVSVAKAGVTIPVEGLDLTISLALYYAFIIGADLGGKNGDYFGRVYEFGLGMRAAIGKEIKGSIYSISASEAWFGSIEGFFADLTHLDNKTYYWVALSMGYQLNFKLSLSLAVISANVSATLTLMGSAAFELFHATTVSLTATLTVDVRVTVFIISFHFHLNFSVGFTWSFGDGPSAQISGPTPDAVAGRINPHAQMRRLGGVGGFTELATADTTDPALWQKLQAIFAETATSFALYPAAIPVGVCDGVKWQPEALIVLMSYAGTQPANGSFAAKDGAQSSAFAQMLKAVTTLLLSDYAGGALPDDQTPSELKISPPTDQQQLAIFQTNLPLLKQLALLVWNVGNQKDKLLAEMRQKFKFKLAAATRQTVNTDVAVIVPFFSQIELSAAKNTVPTPQAGLVEQLNDGWFQLLAAHAAQALYDWALAQAGQRLCGAAINPANFDFDECVRVTGGFLNRNYLHGCQINDVPLFVATGQQFAVTDASDPLLLKASGLLTFLEFDGSKNQATVDLQKALQGFNLSGLKPTLITLAAGDAADRDTHWQDRKIYPLAEFAATPLRFHLKPGVPLTLPGKLAATGFAAGAATEYRHNALPRHLLEDFIAGQARGVQLATFAPAAEPGSDGTVTPLALNPNYAFTLPLPVTVCSDPDTKLPVFSLNTLPPDLRETLGLLLASPALIEQVFVAQTDQKGKFELIAQPLVLTRTNVATSIIPPDDRPGGAPTMASTEIENTPFSATLKNDGTDAATEQQNFLRLVWEASIIRARGYNLYTTDTLGAPPALSLVIALKQADPNFKWTLPNSILLDQQYETATLVATPQDAAGHPLTAWHSQLDAGQIGFEFSFPAPGPDGVHTNDLGAFLQGMYHVGQWRISKVSGDAPATAQDWSTSFSHHDRTVQGASRWYYGGVIDVGQLALAGENPYALVGQAVEVEFRLLDVYGNAFPTTTTATWPRVLYSDFLLGPHEWLHTAFHYGIVPGGSLGAQMKLALEFSLPGGLDQLKTPAQAKANRTVQHYLRLYQKIVWQLDDPNTSIQLFSSLLGDSTTPYQEEAGLLDKIKSYGQNLLSFLKLSDEQASATTGLKDELKSYAQAVLSFFQTGDMQAELPGAVLSFNFDPKAVEAQKDLFELQTKLVFTRPQALAAQPQTPAIYNAAFVLSPNGDDNRVSGEYAGNTSSVQRFALDLEAAYSNYDGQGTALKLAQGPGTDTAPGHAHSYWLMKWRGPNGVQLSFPADAGAQQYFAPQPLSNRLLSQNANAPLDAAAIVANPALLQQPGSYASRVFPHVDVESWARDFLEEFHNLLRPERASLMAKASESDFRRIMLAKFHLGKQIAGQLANIFAGGPAPDDRQRDYFEEALFTSLTNDYGIATLASVKTLVTQHNGIDNGAWALDPLFLGRVNAAQAETDKNFTFSNATVTAHKPPADGNGEAPFLVSAKHPQAQAYVEMTLDYDVTAFDYLFQTGEQCYGFVPSTWLAFVLPQTGAAKLDSTIGDMKIPLPLRSLPAAPRLVRQAQEQDQLHQGANATQIADALKWSYTLQVARPEAAQDEIVLLINFNEAAAPTSNFQSLIAETSFQPGSLLEALAIFRTVYPRVKEHFPSAANTGGSLSASDAGLIASLVEPVAAHWDSVATAGDITLPTPGAFDLQLRLHFNDDGSLQVGLLDAGASANYQHLSICDVEGQTPAAGATEKWLWNISNEKLASTKGLFHLTLDGLDVLNHQCIQVYGFTERNRVLVPDLPTNPVFIYQSPTVKFPAALSPYLENHQPMNFTGDNLTQTVQNFFSALSQPLNDELKFSLQIGNTFALDARNDDAITATRQLFFTQQDLRTTVEGNNPLSQFQRDLVNALTNWHQSGAESTALRLVLTIFATTGGATWFPLAKLTNLNLEVGTAADWWQ